MAGGVRGLGTPSPQALVGAVHVHAAEDDGAPGQAPDRDDRRRQLGPGVGQSLSDQGPVAPLRISPRWQRDPVSRQAVRFPCGSCSRLNGDPSMALPPSPPHRPRKESTNRRSLCDCKGFKRWGWHRGTDGKVVSCKHLDSCLALVSRNRI